MGGVGYGEVCNLSVERYEGPWWFVVQDWPKSNSRWGLLCCLGRARCIVPAFLKVEN